MSERAPLDAAIGLAYVGTEGDSVVFRFDPEPIAIGATEPVVYLHGGALATCVDTAAYEAVARTVPGDWVAVDIRVDFLRLAGTEPHRVVARCLRAGRRLAVADVEIAPWDDPGRLVALGRAQFARL
jgi:uncharacterized protein (TIGR00369 family)